MPCASSTSFAIGNGLRVILVEHHAFPSLAARLVFPRRPSERSEADFVRLELMGATFFAPLEAGEDATGRCSRQGCLLADWGVQGELGSMLERLAALVVHPSETVETFERRLLRGTDSVRLSGRNMGIALWRNAYIQAFGTSPLGGIDAASFRPQIEDLERIRDALITPGNATLVIAGDTLPEQARAAVESALGAWAAKDSAAPTAAERTVHPTQPGIVLINIHHLTHTLADLVVRGPPREDRDAAAFALAAQILGGGMSSVAFRYVREDLPASYAVGARVEWFEVGSMLRLGGALDPENAIEALRALLRAVRELRAAGPKDADVERAKATLRGAMRQQQSSSAGIASNIAAGVLAGAIDLCAFVNQLDTVSAGDVKRVVTKYFAEGNLHMVAAGPKEDVGSWLSDFGLGPVTMRDGFGRNVER